MKLLGKFLITGGDSIAPNPRTPHETLGQAIHQASVMIDNRDFNQEGAIIWIPYKCIRKKPTPVEVTDAPAQV